MTGRSLQSGADIYNVNLDVPSISSDSEFAKYLKSSQASQANLQPPRYAQDPLSRQLGGGEDEEEEEEKFQLMPPRERQDPLLRQLSSQETFRVINLR